MPSTPILGITQVSTSQNGKEATINDAILALEEATNAKLVVSLAAGNATLTATEATRNFIFEAAGATAERELRFPMAVNGNPYNRVIVVRNESGHGLTVRFTDNGLTTVIIPNGESRLISADAATGMDVAAEPPSVISFLSLTDTPNTFTGSTGKFLTVNAEGTALEFVTGAQFPSLTGNANRFLMVNADGTGVEWAVPNIVTNFVALTDTPNSYSGQAGKLVRVNSASSGLEFITPEETEAVSFVNAARWRILALEPGEWPENPPGLDPSDPEYITPTDQVGFGEIEFLDLDGLRINIAGTASASNAQSGFEADRAFNEITTVGDGWRTEASYSGTVWIEFEFSTQVSPRRVRLTPINGAPQYAPMRFLIQYWDGAAWISLGDRTPASWESEVPQTFRINGIPLSTLSEAPQNSSLYGRFNGQWLKINAEAVTDSTTSYNLDATHVFQYRRFTNAGAKTLNIRTNATHAMPDDGEWFIYNATGGVLTIAPAAGVTVNAPVGGSLIVPVRGTVRIKRVGVNTYDLMGDTLSTESGGEVPPLIGNANRILSVNGDATAMAWIDPPITYTDEQARDAVGTALVAGTNVDINVNDAANTITISASGIGLDAEGVRDTIGNALRAGTNIELNINDAADTITIATTALDAEGVRDTIGATLVAGSNIAINVNDAANTITVAATMDQEVIRDTIATALVAGDNISIVHDDAANTITITAFGGGGGGGLSAEDVRDVVGATLVAGSNVSINVNDALDTITINATTDPEVVRDTIGSALVAGSNVSINVNDAADTITVSATMDQEVIRDTVAASLVAGTNISIVHDDPGNTITISAVGSAAGLDAEQVRDLVGTTLVAGSNVTIDVNDLADTITINAAGTDAEIVRDTIGSALVAGSNITINVNDAANTITISAAGTDPEVVRDTMGAALVAGAGIGINANDAADTITITNTFDAEFVRDTIGTTLIAGENVEILVDDLANTITISAVGGTGGGTGSGPISIGTSWSWGSSGDRRSFVTVSGSGGTEGDPNIPLQANPVIGFFLSGGSTAVVLTFDFGVPLRVTGFGAVQDFVANHGTYTIEASNDLTSWAVMVPSWDWTTAVAPGSLARGEVTWTNTNRYRYYRVRQIGGANNGGPWVTQWQFRSEPIGHTGATGGGGSGTFDPEEVRDTIAAALVAGNNVSIGVDDAADTITISATTDPEVVRDTIGAALVAGSNVTIAVNDATDTITIAAAGTDPEVVRDTISAALVAGAGIAISVNDAADTITISATGGGGGGLDAEAVRDTIAASLVAGPGIAIENNDAADTITISTTGGSGGGGSSPAVPVFPKAPRLANFTQRNISSPAFAADIDRGIVIGSPASGSNNLRMLTVPIIAAPWTMTAKLSGSFLRREFVCAGLVLANPTANQWRTVRNFQSNTGFGFNWGFGTHNSLTDIANSQTIGENTTVQENDFWVRVTDNGTIRSCFVSDDGMHWQEVVRESSSLFTATDVGVVFSNLIFTSVANIPSDTMGHMVVEYFEYCPTSAVSPISSTELLQALPVAEDNQGIDVGAPGGLSGEFAFLPPDLTQLPTAVSLAGSASSRFLSSKGLAMALTAGPAGRAQARVQPAPALPFTITARVLNWADAESTADRGAGIVLRNSSNGRSIVIYQSPNGGGVFGHQNWSDLSTVSTTVAASQTLVTHNLNAFVSVHVGLDGVATSYWSQDGVNWSVLGSQNISAFLTAAGGSLDQVGVWMFGNSGTGRQTYGLCTYYRVDAVNPPAPATEGTSSSASPPRTPASLAKDLQRRPPRAASFPIVVNSPTVTESEGALLMSGAPATATLRAILKPVQPNNFTVITRMRGYGRTEFDGAGIVFRDTSGRFLQIGPVQVFGGFIENAGWFDSFNFGSSGVTGGGAEDFNVSPVPEWFKAEANVATNTVTASYSFDGENWITLGTPAAFGTIDAYGIGVSNRSTATTNTTFLYFEDGTPDDGIEATKLPSAGAGAGGALRLIQRIRLTSPSANIVFENIPDNFTDLRLTGTARVTGSVQYAVMGLRFNNDSGNNYSSSRWNRFGSDQIISGNRMDVCGVLMGADNASGVAGSFEIEIPQYRQTTFHKQTLSKGFGGNATQAIVDMGAGTWFNAAAVNQITVFTPDGGTWAAGTELCLWGIEATSGEGSSAYLPMTTITGTSYDLPQATAGRYLRFTATSDKVINVRPELVEAMPMGAEWHFRNAGPGTLTIVPGGGVVINAPAGGSLVIPQNAVATLKRLTTDNYDLMGTTLNGLDGPPYVVTSGAISRPLGGETLLIHIFSESIEFAADFAGSRGFAGTLPTANTSFSIRKNGTPVGGILITTTGTVTFTSSGGDPVSYEAGDVMTIVAQDPADLTIANVAFNLRGIRL